MKVAIYCRLSEEDRNKQSKTDDSGSIQNQKSMLIRYAMERDWEIYNIYSDDDYTGSDRHRPEFCRLLKDAEERRFDIILCKTQSRFTRELELVEKYIHGLFPIWGIRFISVVDNADTENKGNKKARQINGLINEWYLEDMSENIKSVLTDRRKKGCHIGAFALYGYQKDPEKKGHLIIDEEAAAVVREVFSLFAQGYGKSSIARMLNERGVPNPTEYKRQKGLRYQQPGTKNSTLWKYFAIADMLGNEMYIGNMVQGKYGSISYKTKQNKPRPKNEWYRVEGTHEPIIDMELWNEVQELLRQKAKPFITGNIGLFARKARCMYCGYTMRSCKNRERRYLKCATKHVAKDACIGSFISVSVLEQAVLSELRSLSDTYLNKSELEVQVVLNHGMEERQQLLMKEQNRMQQKLEEYVRGLRELYMDKVKGVITEKDYVQLSKDFTNQRERLEQMLADCDEQLAKMEQQKKDSISKQRLIEQYTSLEHLDRPTVEKLIDYILVGKRQPSGEIPIEIHWNF